MATITKNGITVTYTGAGTSSATVSATQNEGIDKTETFTFKTILTPIAQSTITVTQLGLREVFTCTDGAFLLSDGETFNELK